MSLKRRLKEAYKQALRKMFELGQFLGFDVLPRHFYSEIPYIRALRKTTEWRLPYSMLGVSGADIESQLDFVKSCCTPAMQELLRSKNIHALASERDGEEGFGPIEADFLYALSPRPR